MTRTLVTTCVACGAPFIPEWVVLTQDLKTRTDLCLACREQARHEPDRFTARWGPGV